MNEQRNLRPAFNLISAVNQVTENESTIAVQVALDRFNEGMATLVELADTMLLHGHEADRDVMGRAMAKVVFSIQKIDSLMGGGTR